MAINHSLSSNINPEEALWWQQLTMNTQPTTPTLDAVPAAASPAVSYPGASAFRFNGTRDDVVGEHQHSLLAAAAGSARRDEGDGLMEPMFEKPLTPSDVGKLNRLVIPKQHAEKYLPLCADSPADKGQLLSFEDESGKPWRFRYSYWNSSQSYVLTKGWSRFVKEKRLDAGDVILFLKHSHWPDKLFIGCRRRAHEAASRAHDSPAPLPPGFYYTPPYPSHLLPCQAVDQSPRSVTANGVNEATVTPTAGKSKRLRLFGVNLEWQPDRFDSTGTVDSPISTGGVAHPQLYTEPYRHSSTDHMDVNFARDVNHQTMMNRRG